MQSDIVTSPIQVNTICNVCSVGCSLAVSIAPDGIVNVTGRSGLINREGEFCNYPEAAILEIGRMNRITKPMLSVNGEFQPIEWEQAFTLIHEQIKSANPDEMAFFAGARLSNEEQYLLQKLARAGASTNNISNFHYLGRDTAYARLTKANLPFPELERSVHIYLMNTDVATTHPVLAGFIAKAQTEYGSKVTAVSSTQISSGPYKQKTLHTTSIYHFIRAVNHFILSENLEDHLFLDPLIGNFQEYKNHLLATPYAQLVEQSGMTADEVGEFADTFIKEKASVMVMAENNSDADTCSELFNLACISGKHGKPGSGLILLKEKNNSHGLYDMGIMADFSPGTDDWQDPMVRQRFQHEWESGDLPDGEGITVEKLVKGHYKKIFIFGEDPVGCAYEPEQFKQLVSMADFSVVQDYVLTETAKLAHLVLPASWPWENGGTFTNSQKVLQNTGTIVSQGVSMLSWQQLDAILASFGLGCYEAVDDIMFEVAGLLPRYCTSSKLRLRLTNDEIFTPIFRSGCDVVSALAVEMSSPTHTP